MFTQYATKKDLKEAAAIEFRRRNEEERKRRIFNPRVRLIGIDKDALDKQMIEKNQQREHEANIDRQFDNELERRNHELNVQLDALADERLKLQKEMIEFRANHQRREQTREFDLNDPKYLSNCLLGRDFTGQVVKLANSLSFMGEDEYGAERNRQQKEQQRAWLQQQIQERNRIKAEMAQASQALDAAIAVHDERIRQIDDAEQALRREIKHNTAVFNLELAREQQASREQRRREDDEDAMAQILNMLTSDMLTENKEMGQCSNLGPKRKVISQYRGMTDEEVQQIRDEQKQQIVEKVEREHSAKETDEQFDRMLAAYVENSLQNEREYNRQRQEIADQIKTENKRLEEEQRQVQNAYYASDPNDEYFAQFNTTTR